MVRGLYGWQDESVPGFADVHRKRSLEADFTKKLFSAFLWENTFGVGAKSGMRFGRLGIGKLHLQLFFLAFFFVLAADAYLDPFSRHIV